MQNFTRIPNTAFEMKLSPIEFCVLCCLLKCRNSVTGKCFPSYSKIARECHIARSSVAKAVKSLQEKHILKVQQNYHNHKQRCNTYEFAHGWCYPLKIYMERRIENVYSDHRNNKMESEILRRTGGLWTKKIQHRSSQPLSAR